MIHKTIVFILFVVIICGCDIKNKVNFINLSKSKIDSLRISQSEILLKELHKTKADTFGDVKYIPYDFKGCLNQLDSLTSIKMKEWIICLPDGEFSSYVHFSFGMYLRNNWGLWGETKLARNLHKMGILHPDDMTEIILTSYQRKLKGEDMKLSEQIKFYQDYWRETNVPVDSILKTYKYKKIKA